MTEQTMSVLLIIVVVVVISGFLFRTTKDVKNGKYDRIEPSSSLSDIELSSDELFEQKPSTAVEHYSGARLASNILVFFGWLGVIIGAAMILISLFGSSSHSSSNIHLFIRGYGIVGSGFLLLASFIQIGIGELIKAMVNSAEDTREILTILKSKT